jgi:capsular polysaccharide export protein
MTFDFLIPVLQHTADIEFYDALGAQLESEGAAVAFLAVSRRGQEILRRRHSHVFYLYEGLDRGWRPSPRQVREFEDRYRVPNMADLVFAEAMYYGGDRQSLVARAIHDFKALQNLLDRHRVQAFVNNVGGEIVRRCMARMAEAGGPPNIIFDFAPFQGRIALTTSEYAWDSLSLDGRALSGNDRAAAEDLVRSITAKRQMFGKPQRLGVDLGSLYRPFKHIYDAYVSEDGQVDYSAAYVYRERLKNISRRMFNRALYQQPTEDPYLFFPLHDPKDSAITVRAPQFQRQEVLIEYLASRALPAGIKLFVKPHPAAVDSYPAAMLAGMRRLPGVRIIDPRISSHELISRAQGVVVINSTVGFESMFYYKPVITLGRVFYRGHGVTFDVENSAELAEKISAALRATPDREAVLRFIWACFQETRPGRFGVVEAENVRQISRALQEKLERVMQRRQRSTQSLAG